jgi:putative secreted protein
MLRSHTRMAKVLHFSDLHLFPGQEFIIDFLQQVRDTEEFDYVISTGDNFGSPDALGAVIQAHEIFADFPGAFVFGSNDYYSPKRKSWTRYLTPRQSAKVDRAVDLPWTELAAHLRSMGWADLSNASAYLQAENERIAEPDLPMVLPAPLALLGVDDPHINRDSINGLSQRWLSPDAIRIGVTHAPYTRILDSMTHLGTELILAGHTHGGQIGLPGVTSLVTNCDLPREFGKGLHVWETGVNECSWLHVSAGLGTSPYAKVRIATRPEVSILTIHD